MHGRTNAATARMHLSCLTPNIHIKVRDPGMSIVKLRKNEERRIQSGHLWIFSNEVDIKQSPLNTFTPGQSVSVQSSHGSFLGHGYINPHSLIAVRICSRDKQQPINRDLIYNRLSHAFELRKRLFQKPYYRLVHSEGDFLPGVIIDRYDEVLVVQLNTAGMEVLKDDLLEVLHELLNPKVILLRNDSPIRQLESLTKYSEVVYGLLPDVIELEENGLLFNTSLNQGQKTGWFYDHRENRAYLQQLAVKQSVLDVFSYVGGWGINAACAGARDVLAIDASESALNTAKVNAELNGVASRFSTKCGDACEIMRELHGSGKRFDVVVLDPPAYIKRKKDHKRGLQQYELINRLAVSLLTDEGTLVSASCSQHLSLKELNNSMLKAARKQKRNLQIFHQGGQGSDHPANAAMEETRYLKAQFSRVLK